MTTGSRGHIHHSEKSPGTGDLPDLKAVLIVALDERNRKFTRQVKNARSNPTEKTVHDLRVAARRLMAVIDIVKSLHPGYGDAGLRKLMKAQLKSLSDLRDTQVQIVEVRRLAADHDILSIFLGELATREATESKRARKEIQRFDIGMVEDQIGRLRTNLERCLSAPAMNGICRAILLGLLAQMYLKTYSIRKDIAKAAADENDPTETYNKIHRLRLIFKNFRYTVEIMRPILPGVSKGLLNRMREYQSGMGTVQDAEVLLAAISSHAKGIRKKERKRSAASPDGFASLLEHLKDRLERESDRFISTMDELDEFWKHIDKS